jgi:WD40 repeat protein/DNA-binding SARP family transcriptional activator
MRCGRPVSAEQLADALWGEQVPPSWAKVVQGCVMRLRRTLGPTAIETMAGGYRLNAEGDDVDVLRFERLLRHARQLLELGDPERAVYAVDEALALWRGRPLVDVEEWEPARVEAQRLDELRLGAEELRLDAALRSGQHRDLIAEARSRVDAAPTRERRWELLALAQYRSGGQSDALRTLHDARSVLAREVGLDPGPALIELERAILRQDERLAPPDAPQEASGSCPWPGLLAYGVGDGDEFFGRDAAVDACVARLSASGVLAVVGPSGVGKSSLVRAGVAASLVRSGRSVAVVTPADGLLTVDEAIDVLVVDQCEAADGTALDLVVEQARRRPVLVALRADRLAEVSRHAEFAQLVERGLFLLGPMTEPDLRAAIEGPARRAGLRFEPGLVDLVVGEVLHGPGGLPLMSHALARTWERREGRVLTVAAYQETGGIRGAVAQSAEAVYADLGADDRVRLRDLFLRLVTPIDDGAPVRTRLPHRGLSDEPRYERLIERLVEARLVTSDDESVEIAHETLVRAWPRLTEWLEEDVEGSRILGHLTMAATAWDVLGRPESELYRGVRLARALEWQARTTAELTRVERSFLQASADRESESLQAAQVVVARERATVRRLRRLIVGVALAAVVALVASSVSVTQRSHASTEARIAEARRLAAEAVVARPQDRALLLAVEAVRLWDSDETRGTLLTTIGRSPELSEVIRSTGSRLLEFDADPGGRRAVVGDGLGRVTLYDLATRRPVAHLGEDGTFFSAAAFRPDGRVIAATRMPSACLVGSDCDASRIEVFDAATLAPTGERYEGLGGPAVDVSFSRDGSLLAAAPPLAFATTTGNLAVWRTDQPGQPLRRLTLADVGPDLRPTADAAARGWVSFSPDGARLYASGTASTVVFEVATGQPVRTYAGAGGYALSPDGTTIAVGGSANEIDLVDTATGERRASLIGHDAQVTAAAFSADGARLATASTDATIALWDTRTGERVDVLRGHAGAVLDVAFSRDGASLLSSAADQSVFVWDVKATAGVVRRVADAGLDGRASGAVLVSPTGTTVAVVDAIARIVDTATGRTIALSEPAAPAQEVAWAAYRPDGRRLVTVGSDGSTRLWRVADGSLLASAVGRGLENRGAVAFTADGAIVVADADGTVTELDGDTLEPTGRSVSVGAPADGVRTARGGIIAVTSSPPDRAKGTAVVFAALGGSGRVIRRVHLASCCVRANFSADGERYAFGGFDGRVGVLDVASGRVSGPRDPLHNGPVGWVTFSPDGSTVASMGFDGELMLSDGRTGRPRAELDPGPVNRAAAVGYRPDGHIAVVAFSNGLVLDVDTDPAAWLAHACRVAGRNLTADEWRDLIGRRARRPTCPTRQSG